MLVTENSPMDHSVYTPPS